MSRILLSLAQDTVRSRAPARRRHDRDQTMNQRASLQGRFREPCRRRQPASQWLRVHQDTPRPVLALMSNGISRIESDGALNHFLSAQDVGTLQVDLVDHRDYVQTMIDSEISSWPASELLRPAMRPRPAERLRSSERPRHLVRKIDVTGSINQIELIDLRRFCANSSCARHGL
jgi:hypothetical protein